MRTVVEVADLNRTLFTRIGETRVRHALHRFYREMVPLPVSSLGTNLTSIPNDKLDVGNGTTPSEELDGTTHKLYLYGTPPLILFCIISIAINVKILVSVYWIRRPLSPTLHISLSLAGADAFSSIALGVGLVMNSFVPIGLGYELSGVDCFKLGLEAVRLGAIIITVAHLMALAANHYLGILRPLHYLSIMTHRNTTLLVVLLWVLPLSFFLSYFGLIEDQGFQSENCEINTFLYYKKFRLMFSSLFFGPFLLMVCIYTHIFCIVKRHQASRLKFSRAGSVHRGPNSLRQNSSQQMARNVKAIHTTLYILGSYVVGWMPGTILYILACDDCLLNLDWVTGRAKFLVYNAVNCLIILKTLVNPIIYAARMHEIKVAKRRMHASLCRCFNPVRADGMAIGLHCSSEGNQSNRASLSRTAVCKLASNVSGKNQRGSDRSYTRTNTVL
ncbi:lysophosphatidic acid receptor 1-like [Neodiprion lecontei]|uniref:Lysophosphatidic acid receptor 1-like n=1 Tax=Neodiprion lecontei TaxID=441921 RepID=A0A6J0BS07_NEOLC|nr:lysophosphatidic acid receptor 1-like [Neodiprion lecontei]XP_046587457.1 lysophosphatidic acid receptor 1-like [Neodiprion lecontei]XP_046587458.1 lysophosphatidic acid receptor 1-like [Neodiprion lecontei]XP_046587459.1 lysophosphatidic acid receptor 1-like [Neodiprion lecontei]